MAGSQALENISARTTPFIKVISILLAAVFWGLFLAIAVMRLQYPFELEWMEGGSLDHVLRMLDGKSLYCEPTLDFVPYRYSPLYYYVSLPFTMVMGAGFAPLRLVSLLATLGCASIILSFVRRETGSLYGGYMAASFFVATFPAGGAWFDLARVDMLFLFFLLAGLYVMRFYSSARSVILAAFLMALSFMTKQVAMLIIIPAGLAFLTVSRRLAVMFACVLTLVIVGSSIILDYHYNGWFYFYVFGMGQNLIITGSILARLKSFLYHMVISPYPGACLFAVMYFGQRLIRGASLRLRLTIPAFTIGLFASAFLLWINAGSYYNNLVPGHIALALLFGMGLAASLAWTDRLSWKYRRTLQLGLYLICITQLATMLYSPSRHIPTQADLEAGEQFMELLASYEGEVLVPYHSYIPTMAGKSTHANRMAMADVMNRTTPRTRQKFLDHIRERLGEKRYRAIVLDHRWFDQEMRANYDSVGIVFEDENVFWPVTGWRIRPSMIWTPKAEETSDVESGPNGPAATSDQ